MQLDPEFLSSIMFVVLSGLGILALAIILAYAVYGTDTEEE
ncbi:MAG: hypothetical protein P1Q69_02380 [Candidatus Thorarchaeota archaeon]|nr:hypothetical protein [Candidatus Thorarchaeota archaeon]